MSQIHWRHIEADTFAEVGAGPSESGTEILSRVLAREGRSKSGFVTVDHRRRVTISRARGAGGPTILYLAGPPLSRPHMERFRASCLAQPLTPAPRPAIEVQVSGDRVDDLQLAFLWATSVRDRIAATRKVPPTPPTPAAPAPRPAAPTRPK